MDKISLVKCNSYKYTEIKNALEKSIENLGGLDKFIKKGSNVVLKPNLVIPSSPARAATTHPVLVKALADIIISFGANVTIAESPGGPYLKPSLKNTYQRCGIEKAAKESGFKLNYDLSVEKVNNPDALILKNIEIIKPLLNADFVINLPKLKSHGQMRYTGAVKNMYGAIAGARKAEYHFRLADYNHFANAIIDIFLAVKPGLSIMDAIVGMDGNGPSSGNPKEMNFIAAGENAFAVDLACLNIIGVKPDSIPVIKCAIERNLCSRELKSIELTGEKIDNLKVDDFEIPAEDKLASITFFSIPLLNKLTNLAKPKPVFNKNLCIGCKICQKHCPAKIIEMKNNYPTVDLTKCIRCFCCQELCPEKAITIKRHSKTIQSILNNFLLILSFIVPGGRKK